MTDTNKLYMKHYKPTIQFEEREYDAKAVDDAVKEFGPSIMREVNAWHCPEPGIICISYFVGESEFHDKSLPVFGLNLDTSFKCSWVDKESGKFMIDIYYSGAQLHELMLILSEVDAIAKSIQKDKVEEALKGLAYAARNETSESLLAYMKKHHGSFEYPDFHPGTDHASRITTILELLTKQL
jgi:hypothetical protein